MLRLETKLTERKDINDVDSVAFSVGLYDNKIREVLTHFPTGHYVSLVSAYSPISIFDHVGSFFIRNNNRQEKWFDYDGVVPFRNFHDMISRCNNEHFAISVTADKRIQFFLKKYTTHTVELHLSPSAAWYFGFNEILYEFPVQPLPGELCAVTGENVNPPIFLEFLQIICRNACGTSDSNMTMPTCLGIMHITDNFTLTDPHIAVNHRINEGRIIDIEILDQDNQPFRWAPVYLELFVSEKADHEKKRGFFRLENAGLVHLHAPVKLISVPELFFSFPVFSFDFRDGTFFTASIHVPAFGPQFITVVPSVDPFFLKLRGKAITKKALLDVFRYLDKTFIQRFNFNGPKPDHLIRVELKEDTLTITTTAVICTFDKSLFITWGIDTGGAFEIFPNRPLTLDLPSHLWYNNDTRILLYCREFHNRYPVAVARRFGSFFRIINRNFWTWHELSKPTNELHFRADLVIVQPDGSTSVKHMDESWAKLLVFQLFYK